MALHGYQQQAINALGGRLSRTLVRANPPIPKSLKKTIVALCKEALQRGYLGDGFMHPGIKKVAKWGGCSERMARKNIRTLEAAGFVVPIANQKGGRFYATVYAANFEALVRFLILSNANPSTALVSELRDMARLATLCDSNGRYATKAELKAELKGGNKGGNSSARIRILSQAAFERDTNVVEFTKPEDRENANG